MQINQNSKFWGLSKFQFNKYWFYFYLLNNWNHILSYRRTRKYRPHTLINIEIRRRRKRTRRRRRRTRRIAYCFKEKSEIDKVYFFIFMLFINCQLLRLYFFWRNESKILANNESCACTSNKNSTDGVSWLRNIN